MKFIRIGPWVFSLEQIAWVEAFEKEDGFEVSVYLTGGNNKRIDIPTSDGGAFLKILDPTEI